MRKKTELRDRIEHLETCIQIDKNFLKFVEQRNTPEEEVKRVNKSIAVAESEIKILNWVLKTPMNK